jgi:hypothetical protein
MEMMQMAGETDQLDLDMKKLPRVGERSMTEEARSEIVCIESVTVTINDGRVN